MPSGNGPIAGAAHAGGAAAGGVAPSARLSFAFTLNSSMFVPRFDNTESQCVWMFWPWSFFVGAMTNRAVAPPVAEMAYGQPRS